MNSRLPVRVVDVDATRDYTAFYEPHIDPELSGLGYSEHPPGYHVAKFTHTTTQPFHVSTQFKAYQQDHFLTIVFYA